MQTHSASPTHVDVIIVGAGVSGVGAAWHLQDRNPGIRDLVLEGRAAMGGTWDLFRYPGIRSDSDMYTLGYGFRPWPGARDIADGPAIKAYVEETARTYGIDRRVRTGHRVVGAEWSSDTNTWTVRCDVGDARTPTTFMCGFLFTATGCYRYDRGFTPTWPGMDDFRGRIVHPQHWPEDLDVTGKRVVVIGSGATAVTLVPSLATGPRAATHVTMLQRSPTYIAIRPSTDPVSAALRRVLPSRAAHAAARRFEPRYDPWDQRLCLAPDGDFFAAIRAGRASEVTDTVATFTPTGLRLPRARRSTPT